MAQILPQQGSLGQTLGTALGTGIGSALQNLASLKLNQLQQRQEQNEYARFLEENKYSPEQARLIASFPANQRLAALQSLQLSQNLQDQQVPATVEKQGLSSILEQMQTKAKPLSGLELLRLGQQEQLQQTPLGQKLSQEQSPFDLNVLANEQAQKMLNLSPDQQNLLQERIQEISKDVNKQQQLREELGKFLQASPEEQQKQLQQLQQPLFKKPLTTSEKIAQRKLELAERREERAAQTETDKETKQFFTDTYKAAKAADENDKRLGRMEELIKEGKLDTPGVASISNVLKKGLWGFGIDLSGSLNPQTQEFIKLSNDFVKMAKDIYGNRVSNYEVEQFLQTIPSVTQSDDAKLRLIRNLRNFNEAARARYNALKDILAANKGKRPQNIEILVDELAAPELNFLAKQFRNNADLTKA